MTNSFRTAANRETEPDWRAIADKLHVAVKLMSPTCGLRVTSGEWNMVANAVHEYKAALPKDKPNEAP